jgi:hypothetical protein
MNCIVSEVFKEDDHHLSWIGDSAAAQVDHRCIQKQQELLLIKVINIISR